MFQFKFTMLGACSNANVMDKSKMKAEVSVESKSKSLHPLSKLLLSQKHFFTWKPNTL